MKWFVFLSMMMLVSCNGKVQQTTVKTTDTPAADTAVLGTPDFHFEKSKTFGVFRITDKDFAIVRNVQFYNPSLPLSADYQEFLMRDSLPWIYNKPMGDYKYVDTLINPDLLYNKRFEKAFLPKMKTEYFIYGTKGMAKGAVQKVLFQSSECGNDYIAYIIAVNQSKTGTPLIATEHEMPLKYGQNYSGINSKIKAFSKDEATENLSGTENVYQPKTFADYGGNIFFTYHDDFLGYDSKSARAKVQFPERAVYTVAKDGKVKLLWSEEMDLLGLPCL